MLDRSKYSRFHPYHPLYDLRPHAVPPAPSQGDQNWLSDAYTRLLALNRTEEKLVSWDHEVSNDWIEIPRPQRVTAHRAIDIAASGFDKVWGKHTSPFYCPHTKNNGSSYRPLVLRLSALHDGGQADFFHAVDHQCSFKVIVPPLKPRQVLVTWEDRQNFYAVQKRERGEDDDDDEDTPPLPSSQSSSISSASSSSSASLSTISSSTSLSSISSRPSLASSALSKIAVQALTDPSPRYSLPILINGSPPPRVPGGPQPRPADGTGVKSFYRQSVADARKKSDVNLMEYLHQISTSGVLAEEPSSHPAWNVEDPHPVLHIYDKRIYPHTLDRTNNFLQFVYRPIGQAIRQMNSALGIPYADFATLVRANQGCPCCRNMFSVDGYDDHIKDGKCTNHPNLEEVETSDRVVGEIRFRSFRNNKRPTEVTETINSPVGSALLEWNSRLGVPNDVWLTISTAVITCTSCDLLRSFPAHLLHLDTQGNCTDPGQEFIAPAATD
ncbi:hypothetical protein C8R43DRAFT_1018105 [Mycena crocata]|nr:hypothetical protein C8R43DRAFT_1018105 [Mycena crocata]